MAWKQNEVVKTAEEESTKSITSWIFGGGFAAIALTTIGTGLVLLPENVEKTPKPAAHGVLMLGTWDGDRFLCQQSTDNPKEMFVADPSPARAGDLAISTDKDGVLKQFRYLSPERKKEPVTDIRGEFLPQMNVRLDQSAGLDVKTATDEVLHRAPLALAACQKLLAEEAKLKEGGSRNIRGKDDKHRYIVLQVGPMQSIEAAVASYINGPTMPNERKARRMAVVPLPE